MGLETTGGYRQKGVTGYRGLEATGGREVTETSRPQRVGSYRGLENTGD